MGLKGHAELCGGMGCVLYLHTGLWWFAELLVWAMAACPMAYLVMLGLAHIDATYAANIKP